MFALISVLKRDSRLKHKLFFHRKTPLSNNLYRRCLRLCLKC